MFYVLFFLLSIALLAMTFQHFWYDEEIEYQERELEIEALIARMEARVKEERIARCQ
nr:MAG TPA: hypothetical protein [Caudoviricetes sp.]